MTHCSSIPSQRVAMLLLPTIMVPTLCSANEQRAVVDKSGQVSRHFSKFDSAGSGGFARSDQTATFSSAVEPQGRACGMAQRRDIDASRDVFMNVTPTRYALEGSALMPFNARGQTASSGAADLSMPVFPVCIRPGRQPGRLTLGVPRFS